MVNLESNPIYLYFFSLETPIEKECLYKVLCPHEYKNIENGTVARRRKIETLYHRKKIIAEHLKCPPQALQFITSKTGKPKLIYPKIESPFYFNLSHSESLGGLAIGATPLGIDIEKKKTRFLYQEISKRIFSAENHHSMMDEKDTNAAFFKAWTQHEAITKWKAKTLLQIKWPHRFNFHNTDFIFKNSVPYPKLNGHQMQIIYNDSNFELSLVYEGEKTKIDPILDKKMFKGIQLRV